MLEVKVKVLDKDLPIPRYAYDGDAGIDLYSREDVVLKPGERRLVGSGIAIAIPQGYGGFVQPRSGLALKQGVSIVNTPGLIDSKYRGEVGVILINLDARSEVRIGRGDKIAQLVVQKVERAQLVVTDELDETARGAKGFGSSGL